MRRWASEQWWVAACLGLMAVYAALAWTAANRKSATYDEPLSVVSAWAVGELGDYRVDYEHPPLWKRWAWAGNWGSKVDADLGERWAAIGQAPMDKWPFADEVMYKRGNDWRGIVMRARAMMLIVAVAGGLLVAWWAWKLGGSAAAVVATGLYALEPGFLGHGALVKNDVANAVVTCAIFYVTWLVGRKVTVARVVALGVLCGAALVVKLSAVVVGPIVAALLLGRAMSRGHGETSRARSVGVAVAVCFAVLAIAGGTVWAGYGFRYGVARDAGYRIDTERLVGMQAAREFRMKNPGRQPTQAEMQAWQPGALTRAALWMNERRLMPEAWLAGLIFTQRTAAGEVGYLNGERYFGGKWYYFLEAMVVKSPVGTVAGVALALGWVVWQRRRGGDNAQHSASNTQRSTAPERTENASRPCLSSRDLACLLLPAGLLLAVGSGAGLQLGVRYMFPVYPLLFVLAGVVAGHVWRQGVRAGRVVIVGLAVLVAAESVAGWPNYVAFFNVAAGGPRGGFHLLGDSNLDWGQDLPGLAEWRKRNPDGELWLSYFGTEDPAAWGIRYRNLPGGYAFGPTVEPVGNGGWLAVSATNLQGIYLREDVYRAFREQVEPEEVIGGTIYVYRLDEGAGAK